MDLRSNFKQKNLTYNFNSLLQVICAEAVVSVLRTFYTVCTKACSDGTSHI